MQLEFRRNQDIVFHGPENPLNLQDGQTLPKGVTNTHAYVFSDGSICRSVTQILVNQGYAEDFDQLQGNALIVAEEAAAFGTMVHNIAEKYWLHCKENGKPYTYNEKDNADTLDAITREVLGEKYGTQHLKTNAKGKVEPVLEEGTDRPLNWEESVKDHASFLLEQVNKFNFKELYPEQHLALREPLAIAGTSDLIGIKQDDTVVILDYKTGNHDSTKEKMQTNFYSKMLEVNTADAKGENGVVASELYTINSKEKKVFSYDSIKTEVIGDILVAEKKGLKLPEVKSVVTEGGEEFYNKALGDVCESMRANIQMEAHFFAEHPEFEGLLKEYNKIKKAQDNSSKTIKEEVLKASDCFKVARDDFNITLSERESLKTDLDKLKEKYPQAYADCVSVGKTATLYVTPSKLFIENEKTKYKEAKEEAKKAPQQAAQMPF